MDSSSETPPVAAAASIRPGRLEDLPAVVQLLADLGYPGSPGETAQTWAALLHEPYSTILLATVDHGSIAAMITLRVHHALRLRGLKVTIEELVVREDRRGLGLGRLLVEAAKRHAEAVGAVRLEVLSSSDRQSSRRGFYVKNGFTQAASNVYRLDLTTTARA